MHGSVPRWLFWTGVECVVVALLTSFVPDLHPGNSRVDQGGDQLLQDLPRGVALVLTLAGLIKRKRFI